MSKEAMKLALEALNSCGFGHITDGCNQVGELDFNGPEMVFTGDMDESAKVFFDWIAKSFKARLDQERADERNSWPAEMGAMERQVNILTDALAQAKAEEREACAKLCEGWDFVPGGHEFTPQQLTKNLTDTIATRIRARSNT